MPTSLSRDAAPPAWPAGLVAAYGDRWQDLVRLAHLLTGSQTVAEELVQDVFVSALDRWEHIENPGGYLRTSVVNATRDWGRHQQVVQRHAGRHLVHTLDQPDELWDALGRLDHRRRSAVVLRYYLDLPDAEIAALLGCRPGTVRTLIHRALRDLRQEISP